MPAASPALSSVPVAFDGAPLRAAMAEMPSAVTVITGWNTDGSPAGSTLSAVSSLSLDPPLMLACFHRDSRTLGALGVGRGFLIHVLAAGQDDLAAVFAGKGDKFAQVAWEKGLLGMPQLPGCQTVIACEVAAHLPGGDHVIVTGAVRDISHDAVRGAMLYHRRAFHALPQPREA
ncbi:flavin reductase family protein [Xanthobacter sediminis]|uniref:flavin reductase family protein n=1 Tax=Xanthobacter sediminis TaxID=3119926 RepID=UPI00372C3028